LRLAGRRRARMCRPWSELRGWRRAGWRGGCLGNGAGEGVWGMKGAGGPARSGKERGVMMRGRRCGRIWTALAAAVLLVGSGAMVEAGGGGGGGRGGGGRGGRWAEPGRPGRGPVRGPRVGRGPEYDRMREVLVSGTVLDSSSEGMGAGLATGMTVRTQQGAVRRVRLGPPWYVGDLGLRPEPGDEVEVIGAESGGVRLGELIAREVRWRGEVYRLRTEWGHPVWAGARHERWMRYGMVWDPARHERVTGEVEAVESVMPGGPEMGRGLGLRVRVSAREQERERERVRRRVHLGPAWYVEEQLPDLRPGDEVTVSGSPVQWEGEEVIIASEVVRRGETVRLRNEAGAPEWPGGWQNWGGWGFGGRYAEMYDPDRERMVQGVVEAVEAESPMHGMGEGAVLRVRTREQEEVRAHLGPTWFIDQVEPSVRGVLGDQVLLRGSMVEMDGQQVMMVRQMQIGEHMLTFRERDGRPVWAGRGRGRGPGPGLGRGRGPGVGRGQGGGRGRGRGRGIR